MPPADVTPAAEAPAAPRSRRRLWLGLAAAAVVGATAFGVAFADNFAALGAYRYSPPKEFQGLSLDPDASRGKQPFRLRGDSGVSATTYRSTDGRRLISVTATEMHIFLPASQLDEAIAVQQRNGFTFAGLHDVDPGERGGVMKCGRAAFEDGELALCTWADGSMWSSFAELLDGATVDPDTLADRARDFRRLAEVPAG
ncbi:hypothetical protein [Kitasatospora sp. NPDC093806]|uniref:hypothetical protein n=1 Tax=Kitasatospora sp. NPDC093806 TaxID=3155075 RepID=UPI0034285C96